MSALPAILMALLGLALLLWAHRFAALLAGGLAWQRRNIPDPTIGLQERIVGSRAFTWVFRLVGALLLLGFVLSAFGLTEGKAR